MHEHLLYLSGMKETIMSLFLAWSDQSSFCSWGHIVWRRMLFEKYQDCFIVLGYPKIGINWFYLCWASMLPAICSRGQMVLKKKLFEEYQDGCFMHGHIWYLNGMIWTIQGRRFALVSAQEDIWYWRWYCLKYWWQLPWWHKTMILPAVSLQSYV